MLLVSLPLSSSSTTAADFLLRVGQSIAVRQAPMAFTASCASLLWKLMSYLARHMPLLLPITCEESNVLLVLGGLWNGHQLRATWAGHWKYAKLATLHHARTMAAPSSSGPSALSFLVLSSTKMCLRRCKRGATANACGY